MTNVYDVANFFIDITLHNDDDYMTNLRLNKLLYFAQAWTLVKLKRPLFDEDFEAWDLGPVVQCIYHKYKVCGKNPIEETDEDYKYDKFSEQEQTLLIDVMREYGKYTTPTLVNIAHSEGAPWSEAYNNGQKTINKDSIKSYFSSKELKSFCGLINIENNLVGYRDKDNILVLPKELNDDWKM